MLLLRIFLLFIFSNSLISFGEEVALHVRFVEKLSILRPQSSIPMKEVFSFYKPEVRYEEVEFLIEKNISGEDLRKKISQILMPEDKISYFTIEAPKKSERFKKKKIFLRDSENWKISEDGLGIEIKKAFSEIYKYSSRNIKVILRVGSFFSGSVENSVNLAKVFLQHLKAPNGSVLATSSFTLGGDFMFPEIDLEKSRRSVLLSPRRVGEFILIIGWFFYLNSSDMIALYEKYPEMFSDYFLSTFLKGLISAGFVYPLSSLIDSFARKRNSYLEKMKYFSFKNYNLENTGEFFSREVLVKLIQSGSKAVIKNCQKVLSPSHSIK